MTRSHFDRTPRPMAATLTRRSMLGQAALTGLAMAGATTLFRPSATSAQTGVLMSQSTPVASAPLTVVFVHGAFADGSSWSGVIQRLLADGVQVLAAANPLRGVVEDSAYIASVVNAIPGPVLLVGHSYGGAVISNASTQAPNVVGLVYVAAFAPEEGETIGEVGANYPEVDLSASLVPASVPASDADLEVVLAPAAFHESFAADLPEKAAAIAATMQRPLKVAAFATPSGPVGWKTLPTWFAVATNDHAIAPDQERFYAERAGGITVEIDGSHAIAISQPDAVADLIRSAVGSLA